MIFQVGLGLIPFIFLFSIALVRMAQGVDRSGAIIDGFLAWVAASYVVAEVLGWFHAIAFLPMLIAWLLVTVPVLVQIWTTRRKFAYSLYYPNEIATPIIIAVMAITLFIALTAAPNNWDSQTYHLPRIEHWIQDGSLEHYPSGIERQNALAPLAEILILHVRLLSGSDKLDLLIQWVSMFCSIFAVYRITRQLGGAETQSCIAAIFVVTLPMGVLQSTSTQNDYVTAALLCCFVTMGLTTVTAPETRITAMIEAMAAGAFSGMVKPDAYLIGVGFAAWFAIAAVRRASFDSVLRLAVVAVVTIVVVIGPFAARNLSDYGSIESNNTRLTVNGSFGVKQTLDNLILDTALNFDTENEAVNAFTSKAALRITSLLHLDKHRDDTLYSYSGHIQNFTFDLPTMVTHEDFGPNPVHTILILAAFGIMAFRWWRHRFSAPTLYWCAWLAGVVLFAAVLRWQPWAVRLQLPGFVLAGPAVAMAFPNWQARAMEPVALSVVLCYSALSALFFNYTRSLLPFSDHPSYLSLDAEQHLFVNQPQLLGVYTKLADKLIEAHSSQIGLITGEDDWEYPIWRILRDRKIGYPIRIEHVRGIPPTGQNGVYLPAGQNGRSWPLGPFTPDAVVWIKPSKEVAVFTGLHNANIEEQH
jgi:hypothetical protein